MKRSAFAMLAVLLSLATACATESEPTEVAASQHERNPGRAEDAEPTDDDLAVEATLLRYLPDQAEGNWHVVAALVKNVSTEVAIDVGGQLSIKDASGKLVESINPTPVNILPGQSGLLFEDAIDLPVSMPDGQLEVFLTVSDFRPMTARDAPVSFSEVQIQPHSTWACQIHGLVENTFTEPKSDLQIRVAGFAGEELVTVGFTYIDTVLPGEQATFEIEFVSPALCPDNVDRVEVLPNLGEDKIFNP